MITKIKKSYTSWGSFFTADILWFLTVLLSSDFVKNHLGPALRKSEVGRNISLMIMDDQRTQLPIWADVVSFYV